MIDLPVHQVPPEAFATLAAGRSDSDAIRLLVAAQHSKHNLLIRQVVESVKAANHEQAGQTRCAYDSLASIQERDKEAVDTVLNYPPVGSWARSTIRMLSSAEMSERAAPAQLAAIAAAAALRAGISWSGEIPVRDGAVMFPSVGKIVVPSGHSSWVRVVTHDGAAEVTGHGWKLKLSAPLCADQAGWQGLRSLYATSAGKEVRILIEDLDSYRAPDSANIGSRLPAAHFGQWQSVFTAAWDLLVGHHGQVADEFALMIRAFTPLIPPARGQVSATSRQTFGSIALSVPPDECSLALTIAHEIQHAKLSALLDVVPMTFPDDGARYYAPWRDDPRPVSGLLQGAYAFLGVVAFWREQRLLASGEQVVLANAEFARWRAAVDLVIRTLAASGGLTAQGQTFVAGMARALAAFTGDRVPAEAEALALRAADEHRTLWKRRHAEAASARNVVLG
jgi:HEXXH motif-containing protein